MRVGEERRFIPVVFDAATGHQLPQRFQSVEMAQFKDTAYTEQFVKFSHEEKAAWRARARFSLSAGEIETQAQSGSPKAAFNRWGTYHATTPGHHVITVKYEHAGVTKEAMAKVRVYGPDEQIPQQIVRLAPLGTYAVGKGSIRNVMAVLDSGSAYQQVTWKLISGKAQNRKTKFTPTGPGWVVIEAQHPGDELLLPTKPVQQRILVLQPHAQRQAQVITWSGIANQDRSAGPIELHAESPSQEPVKFSVVGGPAYIAAGKLHLTGQAGRVSVIAEHQGDLTYQPAVPVVSDFVVQ